MNLNNSKIISSKSLAIVAHKSFTIVAPTHLAKSGLKPVNLKMTLTGGVSNSLAHSNLLSYRNAQHKPLSLNKERGFSTTRKNQDKLIFFNEIYKI